MSMDGLNPLPVSGAQNGLVPPVPSPSPGLPDIPKSIKYRDSDGVCGGACDDCRSSDSESEELELDSSAYS